MTFEPRRIAQEPEVSARMVTSFCDREARSVLGPFGGALAGFAWSHLSKFLPRTAVALQDQRGCDRLSARTAGTRANLATKASRFPRAPGHF